MGATMARRLRASNRCEFDLPPAGVWRPFSFDVCGNVAMLSFRLLGHVQAMLVAPAMAATVSGPVVSAVSAAVASAAESSDAVSLVTVTVAKAIGGHMMQRCVVSVGGAVRLGANDVVHMACFYENAVAEAHRVLFRAA